MLTQSQQHVIDSLTSEFTKLNQVPFAEGDIFGIGETLNRLNERQTLRNQVHTHYRHMYENVMMPLAEKLFEQYSAGLKVSEVTKNLKFTFEDKWNNIHPSESNIVIQLSSEGRNIGYGRFAFRSEYNRQAETSQPIGYYIAFKGDTVKSPEELTKAFKIVITENIMQ